MLAALDAECAAVAGTPPGERNNRLNVAALSLGHYVPHLLDEGEVFESVSYVLRVVRGVVSVRTESTLRLTPWAPPSPGGPASVALTP